MFLRDDIFLLYWMAVLALDESVGSECIISSILDGFRDVIRNSP